MRFIADAPDIIRVKNGKLIAPTKYVKTWANENNITEETPVCVISQETLQDLIDKAERAIIRCHFCTKSNTEVEKMIQGFNTFICNECVDICNDILAES